MTVDASAERRARLLGLKLRALVRDHVAQDVGEPVLFPPGAALLHGGAAWVLLDEQPTHRLGAALAWAIRSGADELHVITESGSGVLARRAAELITPISIWHADERALLPAVPEPFTPEPEVPADHLQFTELIEAGGAEPVAEHGVLAGEVRGLEVCRVVDDELSGEPRLEVGIGAHDRDAFAIMHGNMPPVEALSGVVGKVVEQRRLDAPPHPFNRLARERLLRWEVAHKPSLIAAIELAPTAPPLPRANLKDAVPCVASGRDADGRVAAVFSVGVDLDLIPFAADSRLMAEGDSHDAVRLVLVTPPRDRVKVTEQLAGLLRRPCELATHG